MRRACNPAILPVIVGLLTLTAGIFALGPSARPAAASASEQSATELSTDECIEIDAGDTIRVSIYIDDSPELFAFEIYFAYDRNLLEVVDRDVRLFLAGGPNSNVFDFSDPVPNSTGIYRLAAADVALGATAEDGDGVLATVRLRAMNDGVSPAAIYRSNDGSLGPSLTTTGGGKIGDGNGDGVFEGVITSGQIAIGQSCNAVAPTPDPELEAELTPGPTQTTSATVGSTTPGPTNRPGETDVPGDTGSAEDSPGATGTGGSEPTGGDNPDSTGDDAQPPAVANGGGRIGSGIGSSDDNTFWAIVLIGGGVALGLVTTGVIALVTRKPA